MAREIDSTSGVPVYRQLAQILREQIDSGVLAPGARLPTEATLRYDYGVGEATVRSALTVLRQEGLVETRRPQGSFVRARPDGEPVLLPAGADLWMQPATDEERARFGLPRGGVVFRVHHRAETRVYGPETRFKVAWPNSGNNNA